MAWFKLLIYPAVLFIGFFAGVGFENNKRIKLVESLNEAHKIEQEQQQKRVKQYAATSKIYYEQFIEADNFANLDTRIERVYVKANCSAVPAAADSSRELGNGASERAELHPEIVARIAAITNQAQADLLKCSARLHSLQDKIRTNNATSN